MMLFEKRNRSGALPFVAVCERPSRTDGPPENPTAVGKRTSLPLERGRWDYEVRNMPISGRQRCG